MNDAARLPCLPVWLPGFSSFELPEFVTTAWRTAGTAHHVGTTGEELGWGLLSALGAYLVSPPQDPALPLTRASPQRGPGGKGEPVCSQYKLC